MLREGIMDLVRFEQKEMALKNRGVLPVFLVNPADLNLLHSADTSDSDSMCSVEEDALALEQSVRRVLGNSSSGLSIAISSDGTISKSEVTYLGDG